LVPPPTASLVPPPTASLVGSLPATTSGVTTVNIPSNIDVNKLNTQRGGQNSYTVAQLKTIARQLQLSASGNKGQLVNRIRAKLGL
jgi:hypothetical protein